ncbi:WD40-repeat-containing domain protein [Armillaria fumosa]|nr:WD40-repeat-containing domain protein [Armillaria fumosa]
MSLNLLEFQRTTQQPMMLPGTVSQLAFSHNGNYLALAVGTRLIVVDVSTTASEPEVVYSLEEESKITCISWIRDLTVAHGSSTGRFVSSTIVKDKDPVRLQISGFDAFEGTSVMAIDVNPDGRLLALAESQKVQVWEAVGGDHAVWDHRLSLSATHLKVSICGLAWSPAGDTLHAWSPSTIVGWSIASGKVCLQRGASADTYIATLSTVSDTYLTATRGKNSQALTRHQLSTGIALASYEFQSSSIEVPVSFWRQGEGLLIGGLGIASLWLLDYDNHWLQDLLHEEDGRLLNAVTSHPKADLCATAIQNQVYVWRAKLASRKKPMDPSWGCTMM